MTETTDFNKELDAEIKPVKTIADLAKELDTEINRVHTEYIQLHKDLDAYRGKPVGENVDIVNAILKSIQEKFYELYPSLYFIATRYEFASHATNGFNEFIEIETLKKSGAHQDGIETKEQ